MTPDADTGHRLFIQRTHLPTAHLGADPDAPAARPLAAGEARLAVDRFALTANNITYAAFGEAMKYWQFFPSGDPALGCLPVWGFATVAESQVDGLSVGRRVWGYFPAGTHLVVAPVQGLGRPVLWTAQRTARRWRWSTTSTAFVTPTPVGSPSSKACRRCCGRCS